MKGPYILVAEDSQSDIDILEWAFTKAGVEVRLEFVRDGQEAVEYLEKVESGQLSVGFPALLLLDLKMPRMSGFEVLKWLQTVPASRRPIVVVFTASDVPEDVRRALDLGARSYLVKPAEFNAMIDVARSLGGILAEDLLAKCEPH